VTGMIEVPIWHLVVFILGGVATGAIVALLTVVVSGGAEDKARTQTSAVPQRPRPVPAPATQASRGPEEAAHDELSRLVMQRRAVTIDKAARLLDVTPRKVRRWLDSGDLRGLQAPDGSRRVTAISIHDMLVRLTVNHEDQTEEDQIEEDRVEEGREEEEMFTPKKRPTRKPAAVSRDEDPEDDDDDDEDEESHELIPKPGQKYWYFVDRRLPAYHSLREALGALKLTVDLRGTDYTTLPREIRDRITRRRVPRS